MYGKSEIFYLIRDKVIPSLLNSEKTIKFEDIKEIFEKTSYWKIKNYKFGNEKKYIPNIKNKKMSIKTLIYEKYKPRLVYGKTKEKTKPYFNDLLKINNHKNKSRNINQKDLFYTEKNESPKSFKPSKTSIHFSNPILKYYSQKMYNTTETSNNKNSKLKTDKNRSIKESNSIKNSILLKQKQALENNNRIFLKKLNSGYEYKDFYYFKNKRIKKYRLGDPFLKNEEINNHLILRGLSMNDEIKNCYSKCQLLGNEINEDSKLKKNPSKEKIINKKKINKNIKHLIKNKNKDDNNIIYSLKGLLDSKYPINIRANFNNLLSITILNLILLKNKILKLNII